MKLLIKVATGIMLFLFLISCNAPPDEKSTVDIPIAATGESSETQKPEENQNWVILPGVSAEEVEMATWLFGSDDFWTPSEDDISAIEEKITDYLKENAEQFYWQPPVWQQLEAYQRQYIGLVRDGRQIILGNYFCDSGSKNWRRDLVFAIDGGECYFQVEYDVEVGIFIMLQINGES